MAECVVDSSTVLAFLGDEPGADAAARHLPRAAISAVNLHEVAAKMLDLGGAPEGVRPVLAALDLEVVAHDGEAAVEAALLRPSTRRRGLSLGDRACLALAGSLGLPAVTADRAWAEVADELGIVVELIR